MDNATRLQYLEAMGIDVWVSRYPPIAVQAPQAVEGESHYDESSAAVDFQNIPNVVNPAADCHPIATEHLPPPTRPAHAALASEQVWTDLRSEVAACRACKLCETRTQTVFGVGSHQASWMLIGEAPGQNEDLQGEPFVGKAGQLLTEMLRAIGLKREEVFIANVLKCRPPNNRDPQAEEVAACHDFLQRQIELIKPKIIVAVGRIAAQNLLNTQQPLAKLRGSRHQLDNIPLVVVHHPAYLLRALTEKAKAWDDLQFALSVHQSLEN
ncbi:uracil-DNA glycosylase [Methylomonas sp. LL1]|uniref:uracil-DNA glycosylase n=1 Tax=Methylomonas sp. LL1 TaxID=2785785 RepID=UPI0018C43221|nr:uracil-DNA glycosylase [Methylomonas sp. LL1]QPK61780.1 uracil-DNA glycosylase [Methylomonas sp. LL1]